jgi:hypothetical protein
VKQLFALLVFGATILLYIAGQPLYCNASADRVYQLEQPFQQPVPVPLQVLAILRSDKWNRESFDACPSRGDLTQIPASWFVAARIDLTQGGNSGMIVKAENGCLWGANVGPFWVFRHTSKGYALVLQVNTLALEFLDSRINGYRDIQTTAATAVALTSTVYRFKGGAYRPEGSSTSPIK